MPTTPPPLDPRTAGADRPAEFMRVAETCRVFGLSKSGFYRLVAAGHVRTVKLGAAVLVDVATVRGFIASLPPAGARRRS